MNLILSGCYSVPIMIWLRIPFFKSTSYSSVAIFQQHERMEFAFQNSQVILGIVDSTMILWIEISYWGKKLLKQVYVDLIA